MPSCKNVHNSSYKGMVFILLLKHNKLKVLNVCHHVLWYPVYVENANTIGSISSLQEITCINFNVFSQKNFVKL